MILDEETKKTLTNLIKNSKVASLGTANNNEPFVSMVSYSFSENFTEFYILISQLALHTKNILDNPNVCLMICQPETLNSNPQTLARVSIKGSAIVLEKESVEYNLVKDSYVKKNPKAKMYFTLGDFLLVKIIVKDARFVAGFGKAYNLSISDLQSFN